MTELPTSVARSHPSRLEQVARDEIVNVERRAFALANGVRSVGVDHQVERVVSKNTNSILKEPSFGTGGL